MTAGQFYDAGADAVNNSPRPLSGDYLIFGAGNVSARGGGRFDQRARQRPWVSGLGTQVIDRCCHGGFVAVGIEHLPHKLKVDPYRASLLVRLTQPLNPAVGEFRRNLLQPLVYQAESDLWNHGTQIHQMPNRSPGRDQRRRGTAQRVAHDHDIAVATLQRAASHPHRCRSLPTRRRSAGPAPPLHGQPDGEAESTFPNTKRRATPRAPTHTSSRGKDRGYDRSQPHVTNRPPAGFPTGWWP